MVYAITPIDASVRAQAQAGKPFFLVDQCIRHRANVPSWRTSGSWASGSDITDPDRPVRRAYDGQLGAGTSPNDTIVGTSTPVYLLFDLTAVASRGFDTAMIAVDLGGVGAGAECALQIANANTFAGAITIGEATSWETGSGRQKIIVWDLRDPVGGVDGIDVANAQYVRLRFQLGSGPTWVAPPVVYEVALGRRFQLSHFPRYPHDPEQRASVFSDYVADSGWTQRVIRSVGMHPVSPSLQAQAEGRNGIDDVDAIRRWFAATNYGARNFLYCDDPGTVASGVVAPASTPPRGLWCLPPPSIAVPNIGPYVYDFSTEFRELPPYRAINEAAS